MNFMGYPVDYYRQQFEREAQQFAPSSGWSREQRLEKMRLWLRSKIKARELDKEKAAADYRQRLDQYALERERSRHQVSLQSRQLVNECKSASSHLSVAERRQRLAQIKLQCAELQRSNEESIRAAGALLRQERDIALLSIDQDILQLRLEIREVEKQERRFFEPHNFTLVSQLRYTHGDKGYHEVIRMCRRKSHNEKIINKTIEARYWGVWEQHDDDGNLIRRWSGPMIRPNQPYPEFLRFGFVGYRLKTRYRPDHMRADKDGVKQPRYAILTPPPYWIDCEIRGQFSVVDGEIIEEEDRLPRTYSRYR